MKKWNKIATMTYTIEVRNLAKAEIKEALESNKKGYWKQSIVCKIAAHHCLTMHYAWQLFKELFYNVALYSVENVSKEVEDIAWSYLSDLDKPKRGKLTTGFFYIK